MNENLWEFLSAPVTGTLTGLLGTLLSAGLAVYLYRRALPISRLDYAAYDVVVLNNEYSILKDDLEIRFRGKPVPKVTRRSWPFGTAAIRQSPGTDHRS